MNASTGSENRVLTGKKLFGFAFGTMGQMAPIGFYNSFVTNFYNYTVLLDPVLTFFGMFLGLTVFAISSPIFGTIIDNRNPGRLGKRKPVLLICIPLFIVLNIAAWLPPVCPVGQPFYTPTAVYYLVVTVCIYLNQSLAVSTYLSMLAEQTTDEKNRVRVATLQGVFSIIGTVLSILIPVILQGKLADPKAPAWNTVSGQFLISALPIIGIIFGAMGAISFAVVFFSSDESFHVRDESGKKSRQTIKQTFHQMFVPFSDKNYRMWLGNAFFFNMAIRFLIVILIPSMTFVMGLGKSQFTLFFLAILPFALGGYVLWTTRIKKSGLKDAYALSLLVNVAFAFIMLVFIFDMAFWLRFWLGAVIMGFLISSLVGGYLFPNPIVSKLVDRAPEHIKKEAERGNKAISGSYFGLYILFYNISQALANIILLFIITEDTKENPIVIIVCIPISGVMVFISYLFLRRLHLPREMVEKIPAAKES
ncbi:MAG: MFS transporter [Promethearchaeota archaeon]